MGENVKSKKDKKRVRDVVEAQPEKVVVDPAVGGEADEEARRARKKAKKEAKRLKRLQQVQEEAGQGHCEEKDDMPEGAGEPGGPEEEREGQAGKQKKHKKDKKKSKTKDAHGEGRDNEVVPMADAASAGKSLTRAELEQFWQTNEMMVSGSGCEAFEPALEFARAGFPADVLECTTGFSKPTPIQSQCWPILNGGRDIVGIAETGSGKTLAFSLPGLQRIRKQQNGAKRCIGMLVVAPTRELALQCNEVIEAAAKPLSMRTTCVYGGVPKQDQKKLLRKGVDVLVATPGRLVDLIQDGDCDLSTVTYLVLDEADRMLDQGFEEAVRSIISETAPKGKRQTALFSATWPMSIQALAQEFLTDPIKVTVGGEDLSSNKRVKQIVEVVEERDRERLLEGLLKKYHASRQNRVLVFALYKKEAARLERMLQQKGWKCVGIHGDKAQGDRLRALESFKSKETPLMIATDVAARGLDIPDVEVVINFSFPLTIEDYIHRIGRTGRAGKTGIAHTFFHAGDKGHAGSVVNVLRQADQEVPAELGKFGNFVKKKEHKLYGAYGPKDVDMTKKATKIRFTEDDD